jgi:predicted unusual protein kinase regulating ubiquinone biosynthesis (AarF/ABC1/UbiB family)
VKRLPSSGLERAAAAGKMVLGLGRAGVQRLVRKSIGDDQVLGEILATEMDRMKGLAMKIGQIVSYMEVGLPGETQAILTRLQRGAEPLDPELVVGVIESELGAPVTELFERFDRVPVAAASIGQVHRASVRGHEVAVKVRYPGVLETLDADIRHLRGIARIASLATEVDGQALVDELRERVLEECDYRLEAEHQRLFGHILADDPVLVVPAVVDDRSADTVLTTEWHDGVALNTLRNTNRTDVNDLAIAFVRLPWTTLFRHGVLHADPHPGNFLVADGPRLVVLDFGCVKRFAPDRVDALRALFLGVLDDRRDAALSRAVELGLVPDFTRADPDELWALLRFLLAPYLTPRFRFERSWWVSEMRRFKRPTSSLRHMTFPPDWLWIQRTFVGLHAVLLGLGVEGSFREIAHDRLDA